MADLGAPGVKIEEISSGPRPVSMSGTTDTGFVGLITVPEEFFLGKLRSPEQLADGWRPLLPLPRHATTDVAGSWQAALAFLPFARAEKKEARQPQLTWSVNGQSRERKDIEALLRTAPNAKLIPVREGVKQDKDAVEGAKAVRDRLSTPGDYVLELKPDESLNLSISFEKTAEPTETGTRLSDVVRDALGEDWELTATGGTEFVETSLREKARPGQTARSLQVRFRRALLTLRQNEESGIHEWILAPRSDAGQGVELRNQLLEVLGSEAMTHGIPFRGDLSRLVDEAQSERPVQIHALQELMSGPARQASSLDSFEQWQREFAEELFIALLQVTTQTSRRQSETIWRQLQDAHKSAWFRWTRHLPGMLHVELSVRGFFSNGGRVAHLAMAIQGTSTGAQDKFQFLRTAFDSISAVAMIAAPGLNRDWQEAVLNYAGPNGRGDLFAVVETPRFLLTRAEDESQLGKDRWIKGGNGYEQAVLEVRETADETELRFSGYSNDNLLSNAIPRDDRGFGAAYGPWLIVDNPRSVGQHDRYVVCPPAGFIAGMIAATDLRPGAGVHKAPANEPMASIRGLVTTVSDVEQGVLNTRNINIIRRRPFAGFRCWGARTTASDPLWRYVNVRRLFLMVERSLRDAIQWAVFLPNTDFTRSDLRSTIMAFLFRLHSQGALAGRTTAEAYRVRCDNTNNTDADIRDGVLSVDVELSPVYPAEFVRLRFRQTPMSGNVTEGK